MRVHVRISMGILAIVVITSLVYGHSLFGDFVFDDRPQIVDNVKITSLRHLPDYFTHGVWHSTEVKLVDTYRPLFLTSLAINYRIWGKNPFGFHLTNLLFHIVNGILVFLLIRRLLPKSETAPLLGALIFAVHPVNYESVSWISGVTDPLAVCFVLSSFLFYLKFEDDKKASLFFFSAAFYALSVFTKEALILFPAVVATYDLIWERKIYVGRLSIYGMVAALYIVAMTLALGDTGHAGKLEFSAPGMLRFVDFTAEYVKLLLVPRPLGYYLSVPESRIVTTPEIIFSSLVLVAMVLVSLKDKVSLFALVWLLVSMLLPLSLAFRSAPHFAVRYLYLPSAGFAILLASVLDRYYSQRNSLLVGSMVIITFSILTVLAVPNWKNDRAFYSMAIETTPGYMGGYIGLASYFERNGSPEMAIETYMRAAEKVPDKDKPFAYRNIALLSGQYGYTERSISYYEKLLKIAPDDVDALVGLGNNYFAEGDYGKAEAYFLQARKVDKSNFEALFNLAMLYERMGEHGKARNHLIKFINTAPSDQYGPAIHRAKRILNNIDSTKSK